MKITLFRSLKSMFRFFLPVLTFLIVTISAHPYQAEGATVNGMVRQVGNQQILDVWGSNYEMGYAHGYLMADKIRDLVDTFVVGTLAQGNVADYNYHLTLLQYHTFYPESLNEIAGMVDGMIASGKNLYVPSLGRNVDDRDIKSLNLYIEYFFGCASFGMWGAATANGEAIIARNYDFVYDTQGNILKDQMLITYEPTGKPKFVSFAWPGFFGVISGMNEYGVVVTANGGNDNVSSLSGPYHPSLEVFRHILETTTTGNYLYQPLSVVNSIEEYTSAIIQTGVPYRAADDPVYDIEDSDQNVIRYAADTDPAYDHIIATNHFLKLLPPPTSGDSVTNYNTIRNGLLNLYATGDHKVDSTEAWSLLGSVANVVAPTLTSMVVRPNRMEFDVSFAALVNGNFRSATAGQPQTYTWASLFPAESLPDLVVQGIVADPAYPAAGQPVNVTVTVKNQGRAASGGFAMGFYQNLASAPVPQQAGDENCTKSGLAVGATDSCTFTVTYSAAGSYKMWAQVDTGQQVTELDESNNVLGPQFLTVGTSAALNALSLNPGSVTGGATSLGTVTLTGPAPSGGIAVSLSDSSSYASVPASVTVAAGNTSATFTITTSPVTQTGTATISASYGGVTRTAALTVTPPALSTLSLSPASVTGGNSSQGTVRLSGAAPSGGVVVSLSDNSSYASEPASVTVPAGSTSATFTVTTNQVPASTSATIAASYGGVTRTAALTINPASVTLSTLSLNPTKIRGGSSSQGTVTLSGPAPSGGIVVTLSDNSTSASLPASVTVPGGSTSATFTITTVRVYSSRTVAISARYGGVTKTATLWVQRSF